MGSKVTDLTNAMAATLADAIERDDGEWTKPYHAAGPAAPHNPVTNRPYTGINWLFLAAAANAMAIDYGGWATYRQWKKADCQVRKGERSVRVIRVATSKCCDNKQCREGELCGEAVRRWVVPYSVFNATQVAGDVPVAEGYERAPRMWSAREVTDMFRMTGSRWEFQDGVIPHYSRGQDKIVTPTPDAFDDVGGWASTVAHEHAHWTGHPSRTGRHSRTGRGEEARPREELVAELGAVVICSALGLEHSPVTHHARYLKSWAGHLRSQDGGAALTAAAADASRAAGFVVDAITVGIQERATATAERAGEPAAAGVEARTPSVTVAARALPAQAPADPTFAARQAVAGWLVGRTAKSSTVTPEQAAIRFGGLLRVPPPDPTSRPPDPNIQDRIAVRDWLVDAQTAEDPAQVRLSLIERIVGLSPEDIEQARQASVLAETEAPEREQTTAAADDRQPSQGRGGYGSFGL
ncbi:MAG: DUF1738 domain-containing protein [Dehalococcoidia bacterium]|nr:DUF1738 domain-containing protein [Dehalococcoidia bacterium]